MPMSFPDMDSLKFRAKQRGFRQPHEGEREDAYRNAFATFMLDVDRIESAEIRNKVGWDQQDPLSLLMHALQGPKGTSPAAVETPIHEPETKAFVIGLQYDPHYPDAFLYPDITKAVPDFRVYHLTIDGENPDDLWDNHGSEWVSAGGLLYKRNTPVEEFAKRQKSLIDSRREYSTKPYITMDVLAYVQHLLTNHADSKFIRNHIVDVVMSLYSYHDRVLVNGDCGSLRMVQAEQAETIYALTEAKESQYINLDNPQKPFGWPSHIKGGIERIVKLHTVIDKVLFVDSRGIFWTVGEGDTFTRANIKEPEVYVSLTSTITNLKEVIDTTPIMSSPYRKSRAADAHRRLSELIDILNYEYLTSYKFNGVEVSFHKNQEPTH